MSDSELIAEAKLGNEEAFAQLVNESLPKIKTFIANQYNVSCHDIADIVQIATIKAWKKMEYFRGDSSFVTWFFTIVRNETLNFIKKGNNQDKYLVPLQVLFKPNANPHHKWSEPNHEEILDNSLDETAQTILEKQESLKAYRELIEQVLNKLTPNHSQIIRMVMEEEKSYKEISDELGIPIGTVMSRLFFAKKNAKKLIEEYVTSHNVELSCLGKH